MSLRFINGTLGLMLLTVPAFAQVPAEPLPAEPPAPDAPAPAGEPADPALQPVPDAPAPAAPAPAAIDVPPEPPKGPGPQTDAADEAPRPDKIAVGKQGFLQPGALLQGWIFLEHQDIEGREHDLFGTFRLRRAELRIKGQIIPELIGYQVMIDPAKLLRFSSRTVEVEGQEPAPTQPGTVEVPEPPSDTSILQDFYVTFMSEYADVSIGQFKNFVSWEGYNSASKIILPERALSSRTFGDRRDLGLRVEKKFEDLGFGYSAGVFNGTGVNRLDNNNQKDAVLRLEVYPMKGLTVAGLGYLAVGERDEPDTKDRVEGDVRLELDEFLVQAEYIRGWTKIEDGPRMQGHGAYVALGYTFFEKLQPVLRVGFLDQDVDQDLPSGRSEDEVNHYELGLNYYIAQHEAKLQLSISAFDYDDTPTATEGILSAQVSF
ncbi:MAG TPA: porin [Polyangiaceae bacterium]|nr:porin [Polyangiaceae bacterium]